MTLFNCGGLTIGISKKANPQVLLVFGLAASAIGFIGMGLSTVFWLTLPHSFSQAYSCLAFKLELIPLFSKTMKKPL